MSSGVPQEAAATAPRGNPPWYLTLLAIVFTDIYDNASLERIAR